MKENKFKIQNRLVPTKNWYYAIFLASVAIIIGLIVISNIKENREYEELMQSSQDLIDSSQARLAETQDYIKSLEPKIEVQSWSLGVEHGYAIVTGEIKNISDENLKNVEAVASFYTEDGTFISADSALIEYQTLLPGQTSPFKIMEDKNPLMHNVKIAFKTLFGDPIPYEGKKE